MPCELVPPGTHIDFIGKRRFTATISIALLLAGAIAVLVNGVKLGIDFQGGTEMQVLFDDQADVDEGAIRNVIGSRFSSRGVVAPALACAGCSAAASPRRAFR